MPSSFPTPYYVQTRDSEQSGGGAGWGGDED